MDSVLIHDLRGPTLNAMAFNKEIQEGVERLTALLSDPCRTLTQEERVEISDILNDDINPCGEYVNKALSSMEQRLNSIKYPQPDD